jgi:hypothetical protein
MNIPGFIPVPKSAGINARSSAGPLKAWGISWSPMKLLPRSEKLKQVIGET